MPDQEKAARIALGAVAPEIRGAVRNLPPIPLQYSWIRRAGRRLPTLRRGKRVDGVDLTTVREEGEIPRVYRVHRPRDRRSNAAVLWIHGGGLLVGNPAQDDHHCADTARALGITVVAVDYRFAPEHPFPAALDDCATGWDWIRRAAGWLEIDPDRIAIGGQSAGGGLAAALVQRLQDEGGTRPVAQWLFCPMLDDRTAARQELDSARHYLWNNRLNRIGWRSYLGVPPGAAATEPYAVPARREDLSGLPPTWIGVGDIDLFRDEDRDYADRLRAAGVDTTYLEVPGGPHAFESMRPDSEISRAYISSARSWLATALKI